MQSGRIAPIVRQFFNGTASTKSATDSQSQQRQHPEKELEREPTHEEALEALDRLSQQEEFQKSALRAELRAVDGRFSILVFNSLGAQLRAIRGPEIVRLLETANGQGQRRGQILDRRV